MSCRDGLELGLGGGLLRVKTKTLPLGAVLESEDHLSVVCHWQIHPGEGE